MPPAAAVRVPLLAAPAAAWRAGRAASTAPAAGRTRALASFPRHSSAAMGPTDTIDLVSDSSDDEGGSAAAAAAAAAAAEEQQQRKRIMEFARAKAAKRSRSSSLPRSPPAAPAAAAAAAAAAQQAAPAAEGAEVADAPAAAAGMNAMLRELHEARMRRQQQQHDGSSGHGSRSGSGSGPAGDAVLPRPRSAAHSKPPPPPPPQQQQQQQQQQQPPKPAAPAAAAAASGSGSGAAAAGQDRRVTLLQYNVWFREDVALTERMGAIGGIIRDAGHPTFICLQEVTPLIQALLQSAPWWQQYAASPAPSGAPYYTLLLIKRSAAPGLSSSSFREVEFQNSVMGRGLRMAMVNVGGSPLLVATTHLESPIPPERWHSAERKAQLAASLSQLDGSGIGNVVLAGDCNWDEKRDGAPPLPDGWRDAWLALAPRGDPGHTYSGKANPMLPSKGLALRLDRIFAKLRDWRLASLAVVGTAPLPGVTYVHTTRAGAAKTLPVLPSDHFGLLLTLEPV